MTSHLKGILMTFRDFDLHSEVAKGVRIAGFKEPSPIQAEAIPMILNGDDLIAQAHSGTGKTAAFALPILQKLCSSKKTEALVNESLHRCVRRSPSANRRSWGDLPWDDQGPLPFEESRQQSA